MSRSHRLKTPMGASSGRIFPSLTLLSLLTLLTCGALRDVHQEGEDTAQQRTRGTLRALAAALCAARAELTEPFFFRKAIYISQ